tara:strand:- start:439 stop:909 length:471 start_codon:yes stop_codon:yes gene_type:complete
MDPLTIYEKQLEALQAELDEAQLREDARYADYLAHGRGRGRRRAWRTAVRDRKRIQNRMRQIYNKIPPVTRALMGDTEEPSEAIAGSISAGVASLGQSVASAYAAGQGKGSRVLGAGSGATSAPYEEEEEETPDMLPLILAAGAGLLLVVSMQRRK